MGTSQRHCILSPSSQMSLQPLIGLQAVTFALLRSACDGIICPTGWQLEASSLGGQCDCVQRMPMQIPTTDLKVSKFSLDLNKGCLEQGLAWSQSNKDWG